jgi:hypothetical protein
LIGSLGAGALAGAFAGSFAGAGLAWAITIVAEIRLKIKTKTVKIANFFIILFLLSFLVVILSEAKNLKRSLLYKSRSI